MSAETNPAVETVSLREFIEARLDTFNSKLDAIEKETKTAFASSERAIAKAELAADKRFESINELRKMAEDNTRLYMPRSEYEQAHSNLSVRMDGLKERLDEKFAERKGIGTMAAYVVGALGFFATIINVIYYLLAMHPGATTVISNSK